MSISRVLARASYVQDQSFHDSTTDIKPIINHQRKSTPREQNITGNRKPELKKRMRLKLSAAVLFAIISSTEGNPLTGFIFSQRSKQHLKLAETNTSDLPDYGQTSVDIDQHKLTKNKWRRPELFGKSLIDQTMIDMAENPEFKETSEKLKELGQKGMTKEERKKRRRALDSLGVLPFNEFLGQNLDKEKTVESVTLHRKDPEVLQLNVGLYCNQACAHCHVESSPMRTEMMTEDVASKCIELLKSTPSLTTLDITGGAPEMNESFRYIVTMARALRPDVDIIDRCNLTVLQEPGQEDLLDFLVENKVHVIASLPCYSAENVDTQRGSGVFDRSISALLALNGAGFGQTGSDLLLDLVYNPLGAFLPPPQADLEAKYKEVLQENFGIVFNSLFTMTNMPVKRFTDFLYRRGELKDYMDLLVRNFNPSTMDSLMCGNTISVGYDGKVSLCPLVLHRYIPILTRVLYPFLDI